MDTKRLPPSKKIEDRRKTYRSYKEDRQDVQRSAGAKTEFDYNDTDPGYKESPDALVRRLELAEEYNGAIRSGKTNKLK